MKTIQEDNSTISFIHLDTQILKYQYIESSNIWKGYYIIAKVGLYQEWKVGLKLENQWIYFAINILKKKVLEKQIKLS